MRKTEKNTGQLIREFRMARGLTQMQLAELVGVSYQQIQKYEHSVDNISVERLKQLSAALDVPVALFFAPDKDMVAETPALYGKANDDETALVQAFRAVKDKKVKKAVLEFLKSLAR